MKHRARPETISKTPPIAKAGVIGGEMGNGVGVKREVPFVASVPFMAVGRGGDVEELVVAVVD
jgi:hypothetical protein